MAGIGGVATFAPVIKRRRHPAKRTLHARERTRRDHVQRVLRVLVHLQSHLDGDLSLTRLARLAHLSPHHFQRVFAAIVGESCKSHVKRLRLEHAARELRDGDGDLAAIAASARYADVPTFYRAFRTHFARSPAAWRDAARRRLESAVMPRAVQRWLVAPDAEGQLRSLPHAAHRAPAGATPPARVVQLPSLRIAFVRRLGQPRKQVVVADFTRLAAFAARRGPLRDPLFLRIHHDDARLTAAKHRRIDHAIVIGPRRRGDGDIGVAAIGDAHAIAATCEGPGDVRATERWLREQAAAPLSTRQQPGPMLELLLDDPRELPPDDVHALRDVLVPVTPLPTRPPQTGHPWYWRRRRPPTPAPHPSRHTVTDRP